ncbi:MAG: DNA-3-methyladenine glycosylase 2 family protein [Fimbriimonadaceae bacterium]|nr:DNA-3-methyladenine glycosylase 2 family protein [Fimbriimonadaceae bacterium]
MIEEAMAHLKSVDPVLGKVIDVVGPAQGRQHIGVGDTFEYLAHVIIFQQLAGAAASTIEKRFIALFPDSPFPKPDDILNASEEYIRSAGISRQKQGYLRDLAARAKQGLPTMKEMIEMDDEHILESLTQVKGIGRWTVHMLMMFRLGRPDVLPIDDLGVRNGAKKLYGMDGGCSIKQLEEIAQPWRPYRSIGSYYMWEVLELKDLPS